MEKIISWIKNRSERILSSLKIAFGLLSAVSIIFSITGTSLKDILKGGNLLQSICVLAVSYIILTVLVWLWMGHKNKSEVAFKLKRNTVRLKKGDIFKENGLIVIGMDSTFSTQVDNVIITKNSLHGQLVLKHSDADQIKKTVEEEGKRLHAERNKEGNYHFQLGTIIPYKNNIEGKEYLMVALNDLDKENKASTNLVKYEQTLVKMWDEIDRIYAGRNVFIPVLGDGITRFASGAKMEKESLLRCMFCTLNSSGKQFKSQLTFMIYDGEKELYQYKKYLKDEVIQ